MRQIIHHMRRTRTFNIGRNQNRSCQNINHQLAYIDN
jgi:hypothetical protein